MFPVKKVQRIHFFFFVTLLVETVFTLWILFDIMLALKRTYIFKNTLILIIFHLNELTRQNSYLKIEMISEMQMPGVLPMSKFRLHALDCISASTKARFGHELHISLWLPRPAMLSGKWLSTALQHKEEGILHPSGVFCNSKFALLLSQSWAILSHVSIWSTTLLLLVGTALYMEQAWIRQGSFSFSLLNSHGSLSVMDKCRIMDVFEQLYSCMLGLPEWKTWRGSKEDQKLNRG